MPRAMHLAGLTTVAGLFVGTACEPLELDAAQPVTGNYSVVYTDNLRVYLGDVLVADVASGEDAEIDVDGQILNVSDICGDDGTECPSETYWGEIGIDQPMGPDHVLLNFVNLDPSHGTLGQRMGGVLDNDGTFDMLAGLSIRANDSCAAIGIAAVHGAFSATGTGIEQGVIEYAWGAGCAFGDIVLATSLRLETDYTAVRTGDLDLSAVEPEPPIDENGDVL